MQSQGHTNMGLPGKATDKYHTVLKRKFEVKIGNPEWAKLDRKCNIDNNSDEDSEDFLLKVRKFVSLFFVSQFLYLFDVCRAIEIYLLIERAKQIELGFPTLRH